MALTKICSISALLMVSPKLLISIVRLLRISASALALMVTAVICFWNVMVLMHFLIKSSSSTRVTSAVDVGEDAKLRIKSEKVDA